MKKLIIPIILIIILSLLTGCVRKAEVVPHVQTYEIRPTTTGNCVLTGHNFSILVLRNGSELLGWNDTFITFEFWALPPIGATINDFVTLFFSVNSFDTQLFKYNGAYQIIWTLQDTDEMWYEKGSKTMPFTKSFNMSLEFDFNMYEIALMSDSSLTITFVNKENTWGETYYLSFHVINVGS
jgi:hypothetical protein